MVLAISIACKQHECIECNKFSNLFILSRAAVDRLKDYDAIWRDLRMLAHHWRRVLIPSRFTFDLGASEAIHSGLHQHLIFENPSPIIFMRAVKNELERKAMQRAHVLDGAAMCEALSLIERRVSERNKTFDCFYDSVNVFLSFSF